MLYFSRSTGDAEIIAAHQRLDQIPYEPFGSSHSRVDTADDVNTQLQ